jgi:hypothetical protein
MTIDILGGRVVNALAIHDTLRLSRMARRVISSYAHFKGGEFMKKTLLLIAVIAFLLTAWPNPAAAQGGFENVTESSAKAIPSQFEVGGTQVPVDKQNAAVLKTGNGGQVIVGILRSKGFPPRISLKYTGMLVSPGKISVCGNSVGSGSYGFGLSAPPRKADGTFRLFNRSGDEVFNCTATREESASPKPLAVTTSKSGAKLTFYGYSVDLQ